MNRQSSLVLLALALAQSSCNNAGEDLGFGVGRSKPFTAIVYFDRDNSGTRTTADATVAGLVVHLSRVGVPLPIRDTTTAADGTAVFPSLDPGTYAALVDSQALSDTIVATRAPYTIIITSGGDPDTMLVNLAPPVVTIQEFRATQAGRVRIIAGTIRAGRQQFTDQAAYISDATAALRMEHVRNLNLGLTNDPGDIVRVRGKVIVVNGQAVMDSAEVYLVDFSPDAPPSDTLLTGIAAGGAGGTRDAALVRIRNATILDTTTTANVFRVGVNDGSGRLELQFDPLGFPDRSTFVIGGLIDATGILIPLNVGTWQLWPRSGGDYTIH